jgi:hypothetical protein
MALPIQGLWTSLRRNIAGSPQKALREPRRAASKLAAEEATPEQRQAILSKFKELEKGTADRRKMLKKKVEMFLSSGDVEVLQDGVEVPEGAIHGQGKGSKGEDETGDAGKGGEKGEEVEDKEDEEEKEMTEEEKRGYERAMREMQKGKKH